MNIIFISCAALLLGLFDNTFAADVDAAIKKIIPKLENGFNAAKVGSGDFDIFRFACTSCMLFRFVGLFSYNHLNTMFLYSLRYNSGTMPSNYRKR